MSDPKSAVHTLAETYGLNPDTVNGLFRVTGATPPGPPPMSYEGATLQDLAAPVQVVSPMGPPAAPIGPVPSYEGARLQDMSSSAPGIALVDPPKGAATPSTTPSAPPRIAVQTASNLDMSSAPAGMSSKAYEQALRVANASEGTMANVRGAVGVSPGAPTQPAEPAQQLSPPGMPPAFRPMVVPAHWSPSSRGATIQEGIDPAKLEESATYRDSAAGHGQLAADARLQAAQQMGQLDAAYSAAHAAATQNAADQMHVIEVRRRAYVADETAKLNDLNTQAQKQVDPNAYWKEKGTGMHIAAALMIGLGQFASMWKGGTNGALQIVNDAVDKNIDAQKANIANARAAFGDRMSLYQRNLEAFGDQERATVATKMQYLDQVASLLDQKRAEAKTTDAQAAYQDMAKGVMTDRANASERFAELTSAKVTRQQNDHFSPAQMIGGGNGAGDPKREGNLITLPGGTTVKVPDGTDTKIIDQIRAKTQLLRINKEITSLRQDFGKTGFLDRSQRSTLEARLNELALEKVDLMSVANGQGVVRDAELKTALAKRSGATEGIGWLGNDPIYNLISNDRTAADAMIAGQSKRWEQDVNDFAKSAGGSIYEKTWGVDAHGNAVPTGHYTRQDLGPTQNLAPAGSTPMDPTVPLAAADRPLSETTPYAPVTGGLVSGGRR